MENTWDTTLEIKDKKGCLYQIWTHLRAFRKKVSLTFPTLSVIWNMQLVLCICWDPVVLSFLWRGASALSGEVKKVKGNVTMEKKKVTTKREEKIRRQLKGRTEWSLLNTRQERFWRLAGWKGVGTGESVSERIYINNNCLFH